MTEAGLAKETDLYFMAVVERGTGTILAFIIEFAFIDFCVSYITNPL